MRYAWRGIKYVWKTQKSFRWQIIIGIIANLILWNSTVLILTALILSLEVLNTAIERLCDFVHPKLNNAIGLIKDISAGSVLVSCIIAVIYGFILLIQKVLIYI